MDEQRQDDQLEPIYNSSVSIQDVTLKIYQERWKIGTGGERGSGRSVLVMRHDDGDNIYHTHRQKIKRKLIEYIFNLLRIKCIGAIAELQ